MKRFIVIILAVALAAPAFGQQPTVVCTPTGGTVTCEPQPRVSGKRLALVAVLTAGAVVVYCIVKHHHKHKAGRPRSARY